MKHVSGAKPISIQTLAQQFFDKRKDGDVAAASREMAEYTDKIPSLRMELQTMAARQLMNGVVRHDWRTTWSEGNSKQKAPFRMNESAKQSQARMRSTGAVRAALMSLPYTINGICRPLCEWTGADMLHYGSVELEKGRTAMRNARFAIAVGNAAGSKKVGDALTEEALAKFKEQSADES